MTAFSYMETFLEEFPEFQGRETVLDFYFCLRDFLNVYEALDGHYRIYAENREDGSFLKVRLFCVDPSRLLSHAAWIRGASTILFSATILPVRYYKTLLSGNQEDYAVYVNSPFPEEKPPPYGGDRTSAAATRGAARRNTGRLRSISGRLSGRRTEIIWCSFLPTSIWARSKRSWRRSFSGRSSGAGTGNEGAGNDRIPGRI